MKILYLTKWEIDETSGVYKKIIAQRDALERLGVSCDVLFVGKTPESFLCFKDETKKIILTKKKCNNLVKQYDACYVRFELLRHTFYKMVLYQFKKNNVPIALEIPTYPPYEESVARAKHKLKNKNFIGAFKTYLGIVAVKHSLFKQIKMSTLVCNNGDPTVFKQTKTIRIENGIDFESNPFVNREKEKETINIIAVSNFSIWNGYDLAIDGLNNYVLETGKRNIHLIFVGDKEKASELMRLTKKYNLDDLIEFTGLLSGKAFNDIYKRANVALGGLGDHRRKALTNSSLKAKEYAARGLPMILSESEGIEEEIKTKSFIVEAKEKPVDFASFFAWYMNSDIKEISKEIHSFALENYSWDTQMNYVVEELMKEIDCGKSYK